ncbi:hypothetical protein R1sor_020543 [Riccia sorocarpa]|uniref:Fucosyltransferase n=1 Tax=Riccia sorocarpa TaxID=122646 RepID=A0ABD3IJY5_9MARC
MESSYGKNILLALFVATNLIVVSTLMIDFSPILTRYQLYSRVSEEKQESFDSALAPVERKEGKGGIIQTVESDPESTDWRRYPVDWWENEKLSSKDPNWRGRKRMHDELKHGNLWYDESLENYFIGKLEEHQFPSNCSRNHWVAYQPMASGLLSCVHVFSPLLMLELMKGEGYTVIPVGYFKDTALTNPAYFGCGELKDRHLGCFFNLTSCRIEDDPIRYDALIRKSTSKGPVGARWDDFMYREKLPGGITILKNWMPVWPRPVNPDGRIEKNSTKPKVLFWNEVRKHGSVGVYGMGNEAVEEIWEDQMEFAFTAMLSSWMMRQTSARVRKIADEIMSKYSDSTGRPLWKAPVLTLHVRQTDKAYEDPFFKKHHTYRNVTDHVKEMESFESKYGFKWPSIFLISDSGSAIQSLAEVLNGVTGLPDSENGKDGKRFIMYDWTDDKDLIERIGGHNWIPEDQKLSAQEHFLATLYIIERISDYSIVSYSSNVGRFISELIGNRLRVSCADRVGPSALSIDYIWTHD